MGDISYIDASNTSPIEISRIPPCVQEPFDKNPNGVEGPRLNKKLSLGEWLTRFEKKFTQNSADGRFSKEEFKRVNNRFSTHLRRFKTFLEFKKYLDSYIKSQACRPPCPVKEITIRMNSESPSFKIGPYCPKEPTLPPLVARRPRGKTKKTPLAKPFEFPSMKFLARMNQPVPSNVGSKGITVSPLTPEKLAPMGNTVRNLPYLNASWGASQKFTRRVLEGISKVTGDVDVVFAIDTSGSMEPAKKVVMASLPSIYFQLRGKKGTKAIRFGIVLFSDGNPHNPIEDNVRVMAPLSNADEKGVEKLLGELSRVDLPGGIEPVGRAVGEAHFLLASSTVPSRHIIVLTDTEGMSEEHGDRRYPKGQRYPHVSREAQKRGIKVLLLSL